MLEIDGVSFAIGSHPIIEDVSLAVRSGETYGVIGPNGAGKTTLLRVAAALLSPTTGRVLLEGTDMHRIPERARARRAAFLSQHPQIGFGFRVREVVTMGRYAYRRRLAPLSDADRTAVDDAMESTGTKPLADRITTDLSGGELRRVFLARALAQQPLLLFLDEPTAHLDVRYQIELLELIRHIQVECGLTVVMALHDLTWALRYCHSVAALKNGRVVASGSTDSVLTEERVEQVFGVSNRIVRPDSGPPRVDVIGV